MATRQQNSVSRTIRLPEKELEAWNSLGKIHQDVSRNYAASRAVMWLSRQPRQIQWIVIGLHLPEIASEFEAVIAQFAQKHEVRLANRTKPEKKQ